MYCILGLRFTLFIHSCVRPIFFFSHTLTNEIFVTSIFETMQARVVIFGMQIVDDVLYSGIESQPLLAFFPIFSDFLSFHTSNNAMFL